MLRRSIRISAVVLSLGLGTSLMAQNIPEKVEATGQRIFAGKAKPQYEKGETINGVATYNVKAEAGADEGSSAIVTEYGDILYSSEPRTGEPPTPVRRVVTGLLGLPADDYRAVAATFYFVDAQIDNKPYLLQLDAAGRVRDIKTRDEIRGDDPSSMTRASGDNAAKVTKFVQQWHENAKIGNVYEYSQVPGYYLVEYKTSGGKDAQIVLNPEGRVYYEYRSVERGDLPKPVAQKLDSFQDVSIQTINRGEAKYYLYNGTVSGDEITVRIRPNGDVLSLDSEQEDAKRSGTPGAQTAGERQDSNRNSNNQQRGN